MNRSASLNRREALKTTTALLSALAGIGLIAPTQVHAASEAFAAKSVPDVLKALGAQPGDSADVSITSPDIAENGAVVQVSLASKLAKTTVMALLVEKNPFPLAGSFDIPEGTDPMVQLRCKMGQTGTVYALVKADGRWYQASKQTKVTLGGCGG